ncbi:hypothetical protein PISMIDRAFT_266476 [Pisolithus microcarpus 441]|uniref:Uncharacterized protein n=1 Tax=Pisolithus microcarpus 441 TaxID=765257 RepID=A0A0C9YIJ0_9AGAM|nr:hypothetical protein PISMIDRAFT_266476 [Pisolithus microcarpus 441]
MKSSDFITYDFSIESVFDGCTTDDPPIYEPEFVLRKWHPVDHNREVRCFVRNDILLEDNQDNGLQSLRGSRPTQVELSTRLYRDLSTISNEQTNSIRYQIESRVDSCNGRVLYCYTMPGMRTVFASSRVLLQVNWQGKLDL